ncbi:MAG: hypothetical protein QG650_1134 [Patescibacteria group bacterium]|nr:hypothetical protein [Patescibacteria group bacterium]
MQEILADRVIPHPYDTTPGYRLRIAQYVSKPRGIGVFDVSGLSEQEEVAFVVRSISEADVDSPVHVWGIRSAESVAKIREYYDGLGCYVPAKNRYDIDCVNAPVTFGCDLRAIGYGPEVPPLGSAAAKAVRTAVNLEMLRGVRLLPDPKKGPGKKRKTSFEVLSELLSSGAVAPFRLGRALYFDMRERGLVDGFSEWTFVSDVTA